MYNIFKEPKDNINRVKISPNASFVNVKSRLEDNFLIIKSYYSTLDKRVNNSHILVKLLKQADNNSVDKMDYIYDFMTTADSLVRMLNISTLSSKGAPFSNMFFGDYTDEYIFTIPNSKLIDDEWDNIESVKILYHQDTNLNMPILDGSNMPGISDSEYAVIYIDIKNLASQYFQYKSLTKLFGDTPSPANFVFKFILPNMVKSYYNIAIFNRFVKLYNNEEVPPFSNMHPVFINNISAKVDAYLLKNIKKHKKKGYQSYRSILRSIPALGYDDLSKALYIPHIPNVRQIIWIKHIALLPIIYNLLVIGKNAAYRRDADMVNALIKELKRINNNNLLSSSTPLSLYLYITNVVADIINITKNKGR